MSVNSNKRKGRLNANSNKVGRSKFYPEKNMSCDGIYGNSKLMYTAASLVGCVVQIQVQNGAVFEGVLRTFSHQLDVVLEMAHKVSSKCSSVQGVSPRVSNLIGSYPFEGGIFEKLIFKLSDIILMVAATVDMDYALKDSFTDTAISKFNGQVRERELEPWEDAGSDSEGNLAFSIEDDEGTNGWDANDMFRLNAEKYGVTSSYDNTLQDYTVPLLKKDTDEYKLQEAKALKIAQEIETNNLSSSHSRENGDEEDRFSAVVRVEEPLPSKYVLPQKRRSGLKRPPVPSNSSSIPNQYSPLLDESLPSSNVPKTVKSTTGGEGAVVIEPPISENPSPALPKVMYSTHTLPPRIERRRENEKKHHRGRTDEIEEFKKFSSNFKLTDEKELSIQIERTKLDKEEDVVKYSTLNPNAKEFVFNPNAKAFTPRSVPAVSPSMQEQQQHQQSPLMIHHQPLFTAMPPQYVMQAAPTVITSPFAASVPPRFRKGHPSGIPPPSQLTVQYSSPQGVLHASAPAQGYPQMNFVVGPRVVSPQPVGVIPTSHSVSYCDTSHLPTHLIMSAHPGASHPAATPQQHPPQCQTPVLHPSPSPVHQQPPMYNHSYHPHQQVVLMHHHHQQQQQALHMHHLQQMAVIPTSAAPTHSFMQHP